MYYNIFCKNSLYRKNHALSAGVWNIFEFEDEGRFNLISLLENM